MKKFKVGDILKSKEGSPYGKVTVRVADVDYRDSKLDLLVSDVDGSPISLWVCSQYFDLVEKDEIKEEITISLEKDKKSVLMVYKRDNTAVREERFKLGDGISFMDAAKDILDNFDNDRIKYSLSSLEGTRNAITWDSAEEFIELMDRIFGGNDGKDMSLYIEDGTITIDDTDFLEGFGYNLIPYSKVTMD